MDSFAMFEQADDYLPYDAYDHPFYGPVDVFEDDDPEVGLYLIDDYYDDDPSDFGFDPYAGTYLDDDVVDPYDFTEAFDYEF